MGEGEKKKHERKNKLNWQTAHKFPFMYFVIVYNMLASVLLILFSLIFFSFRSTIYRTYETIHVYQIVCTISMHMKLYRCVDNLALFRSSHFSLTFSFLISFSIYLSLSIYRYHFLRLNFYADSKALCVSENCREFKLKIANTHNSRLLPLVMFIAQAHSVGDTFNLAKLTCHPWTATFSYHFSEMS